MKLLVYRKKTHTDQYQNFTSHHPLHQKLGVIKRYWIDATTLYQSKRTEIEVEHVTKALERCGYPSWTIKKMKEQQFQNKTKEHRNPKVLSLSPSLPYVKGVTEPIQWILKHHEIATSVRPHQNIRRLLVHLMDKVEDSKKTYCVYQIPCKSCNHTYRQNRLTFGTRLEEHKKGVENITTRRFTREKKRESQRR